MEGNPYVERGQGGVCLPGGTGVDAGLDRGDQAAEDALTGPVAGAGRVEAQAGAEQDLVVAGVLQAEAAVGGASGP